MQDNGDSCLRAMAIISGHEFKTVYAFYDTPMSADFSTSRLPHSHVRDSPLVFHICPFEYVPYSTCFQKLRRSLNNLPDYENKDYSWPSI